MKEAARTIYEREKKLIKGVFGIQPSEVPKIPEWITDERIKFWNENLFFIHYIPKISLEENSNLPEWYEKPSKYFYQKIREGKLSETAKTLSGRWILIDGRDRPAKKVPWINASDAAILRKIGIDLKKYTRRWKKQVFQKEYLLDILNKKGFNSRFCLNTEEIKSINSFILDFLKMGFPKTIRLPFYIEYNYLGNTIFKQWKAVETWEWLEDKLDEKYNLASGNKSVSCMAWDPPDFWSTILTFRPVIEL